MPRLKQLGDFLARMLQRHKKMEDDKANPLRPGPRAVLPAEGAPSIGVRQTSGVTILDLKGKLTRGELCNALGEQLARLQKERVVLNLENAGNIDQTGLGTLVRALVNARQSGGVLKLVCPEGQILRVLRLSKLISEFPVFATEAEALASFE